MPSPLLLATNNKDKITELQELLKDLNLQLLTPADLKLELDVVEDGLTYAENAAKKALAFAQASGLISLADDSGLEVDALDGEPGLYSARYGSIDGNKLSYSERRKLLIHNLQKFPRPWTARFKATIAVAVPAHVTLSRWSSSREAAYRDQAAKSLSTREKTYRSLRELTSSRRPFGRVTYVDGFCEGEIISEERGASGFGYDPIFLFPKLGKTMSELGIDEKNRLSHRAKAVMKAKEILIQLLDF